MHHDDQVAIFTANNLPHQEYAKNAHEDYNFAQRQGMVEPNLFPYTSSLEQLSNISTKGLNKNSNDLPYAM